MLRLERALAAAIQQERYTDAANLRDALQVARTSDPMLAVRAQLAAAVESQDFVTAARLRDEMAALTERLSRGDLNRRIDRIVILRGRGNASEALRVATVSRDGLLPLPLVPDEPESRDTQPRVYLQPTWSPSGDFVAMTEIAFQIDPSRIARGMAVAETTSRVIIMNAFDGTLVKSNPVSKPPFFFFWSPDGRCVTLLSNDPSTSSSTVALSVMQVVAPPGGSGLDLDSVTGPIATGHPFLYDFCPRDSSRVVAHMGDSSTVAILAVDKLNRPRTVLTSDAGSFGTPQWHPKVGRDGREVVLFVERDPDQVAKKKKDIPTATMMDDEDDAPAVVLSVTMEEDDESESDAGVAFEKFISNGSSLFETVLRKGAESLGLTDFKPGGNNPMSSPFLSPGGMNADDDDDEDDEDDDDETVESLKEKLRRLLAKRLESSGGRWGESDDGEQIASQLVMCDANKPEIRKVLCKFTGVMAFKLSQCGSYLATLVTNPGTGQDELTICSGDFSPDSVTVEEKKSFFFGRRSSPPSNADIVLSTPATRVLAFFWSPDSKKLLFLSSLRDSKMGAAQWATFDMDSMKVVRYEKFLLSGIYMHCLNFFDQFAASMTPWSPDSDAFCYPGRALTPSELEKEKEQDASSASALSALFIQRDGSTDGKRFSARLQKVPCTAQGKVEPEDAVTIVENVEYVCWSPC